MVQSDKRHRDVGSILGQWMKNQSDNKSKWVPRGLFGHLLGWVFDWKIGEDGFEFVLFEKRAERNREYMALWRDRQWLGCPEIEPTVALGPMGRLRFWRGSFFVKGWHLNILIRAIIQNLKVLTSQKNSTVWPLNIDGPKLFYTDVGIRGLVSSGVPRELF